MIGQLIVQACALLALLVAAVTGGMQAETVEGEGVLSFLAIVILMVVLLAVTVWP